MTTSAAVRSYTTPGGTTACNPALDYRPDRTVHRHNSPGILRLALRDAECLLRLDHVIDPKLAEFPDPTAREEAQSHEVE